MRRRSANEIDWENVAEEIGSVGRTEARELESRCEVLLDHPLMRRYQNEKPSSSWQITIKRPAAADRQASKPKSGLKSKRDELFGYAYYGATVSAALETGLQIEDFTETNPFTLAQSMDEGFWSEGRGGRRLPETRDFGRSLMSRARVGLAVLAVAVLLRSAAADDGARPFSDAAHGYAIQVPKGWSDPVNGSTLSPDGAVLCTASGQANPATNGKEQEDINTTLKATYNAHVWQSQYFQNGATGTIEESGITRLDIYDAPWARGKITYPQSLTAKFGVILVEGPGRIVSVNCIGDPTAYDNNFLGILTMMNGARPL